MTRLMPLFACALALRLLIGTVAVAEPLAPADVPAPLRPWVPWVLQELPGHDCPIFFNAATSRCVWSGPLALTVDTTGGRFSVTLEAYGPGWLTLPGGGGQWPQAVNLDGVAAVVTMHDGRPAVRVAAGRHTVAGEFSWPVLPDVLQVPPDYGLVTLSVAGVAVADAAVPAHGQLWLKPQATAAASESERLDIQVFRQLIDELPMEVVTRIDLDVAGAPREVSLRGMQLPDSIPTRLDSPLPARLEDDGSLRLQLRPGHWNLRLTTRQSSPVTSLALPAFPPPWPEVEIWTFAARTSLRLVEIEGGTVVDPRQTTLPTEWQGLPAYRVAAGEALGFAEQRRGDPDPAPDQLALQRQLWLDFDGGGYTISDHISGQMTRQWRLEAEPVLELGRVLLNGAPQFITTLEGGRRGVEVRRGTLDLAADSRYTGAVRTVPAVGWATGVDSLAATLHLPPGWRLWAARGVDNVPDTWLQRWTLLDLFLVLIAAAAVARLMDWPRGLLALLTLVLIWHEPGAPRQVWLHVLAAVALLRVLPDGRLRRLTTVYRNVALLTLVVISVGFMIEQVRLGLYPQLAQAYRVIGASPSTAYDLAGAAPSAMAEMESGVVAADAMQQTVAPEETEQRLKARRRPREMAAGYHSVQSDYDPGANIQTGPGLPGWQWTSIDLGWSGPVAPDQTLGLTLLSPAVNLGLALLRVILLGLMLALFLRRGMDQGWRGLAGTPTAAMLVPAVGLVMSWAMPVGAELPDAELLQDLQRRLTAPPECLPNCAEIARLRADLHDRTLALQLEVHVGAGAALPLPGQIGQWVPRTVLVDEREPASLYRDGGGVLWLVLPPGTHRVSLSGGVPDGASFQVPFPLLPQRLEVGVSGWTVTGIRPDGGSEPQLIFTRIAAVAASTREVLQPRALPAFFRVERTLRLGLDWRVETRVVRLTPADGAASLVIPLLAGESVTTPDVRVEDGRVRVNLAAQQTDYAWTSVLTKSDRLSLTAPATSAWVETWRADISPLWHAELSGIPVVHHQEGGQWLPSWRPWPGESVALILSRPAGVTGQHLTIDRSSLRLRPAQRATDADLEFTLRSSQGGQHTLRLPEGAALQSVAINGVPQPIRQAGTGVTLPLVPGEQQFALSWRSEHGLAARFTTPAWSLGAPSVNASINVALPADRWTLLTGGPRLGPAVLFWGVLLVLVALSIALGRTRYTPLTTPQWLLLAIGLSQTSVLHGLLVVGWLFALAWRGRLPANIGPRAFNLLQVGLALLTLAALALLFQAIQQGLLGQPDMQIAGNGSSATDLNWFQDRIGEVHPQAWVISVSLWFYRGLMLLWALWLAFALLEWLRWGWHCYAGGGLWRPVRWSGGAGKTTGTTAAGTATPSGP